MLSLDLRMDAPFVKENLNIKWHCDTGFVENIQKLVKEYKASRNLVVNQHQVYRNKKKEYIKDYFYFKKAIQNMHTWSTRCWQINDC